MIVSQGAVMAALESKARTAETVPLPNFAMRLISAALAHWPNWAPW